MKAGIIIILTLCSSIWAFGQACCSGGTPLASNLGIQYLESKSLQVQVSYDYNTQRDLVQNSEKLKDDSRHRDTHSGLLRLSYSLSPKWNITTLFSWVRQEENIFRSTGNRFVHAQGFGDIIAMGQYQLLADQKKQFVIAGGVKFPVGKTSVEDETTGILLNPDLQPGTGAWDYILGFNGALFQFLRPTMTLNLTSTYRFTTEDERFGGLQIYEFGDEWITQLGVQDQFLVFNMLLDPGLILKYRHTAKDVAQSSFVPNTSGHWFHLIPNLNINLSPKMQAGVAFELPVFRQLEGIQLTTTRKLTLYLNYTFSSDHGM